MSSKNLSNATLIFEAATIDGENFRLQIAATCTGCGRCVAACPIHALTLVTERADGFGRKTATVATKRCTGCGICLPVCQRHALSLFFRS